jgi:hypothetical protein
MAILPKPLTADLGTLQRLKPGEPIPMLNGLVTVEELGLRIPPPPASPRQAFDHFRQLQQECAESLTYLNRELDQLNRDQVADIARMRAQPELVGAGMDQPVFRQLKALAKDSALESAEAGFVATTLHLKLKLEEEGQRTAQTMNVAWSLNTEQIAPGQIGATIANLQRAGRQFKMSDCQAFLDQYGPVFKDYSKAVDGYVAKVASALEAPESKMPLSTLVLARLCKIRVLSTYLIMTKANFQIWASSAGTGGLEPPLLAEAYEPTVAGSAKR